MRNEMNPKRQSAFWTMVVLGLFVVAVAAALVAVYFQEEKAGVLASTEIATAKKQLEAAPKDEALKERIRAMDERLRHDYLRNRRRFQWAGYLLLAAMIGWAASARWYWRMTPERLPDAMAPRPAPPKAPQIWAVAAAAAALFAGLALYAHYRSPVLPPVAREAAAPVTSGTAAGASATTATVLAAALASAPAPTAVNVWPCFRGPDNIGVAGAGDWPTTWSVAKNRNVVWTVEAPVIGKSSPIVWGGRVFITGGDKTEHAVVCFDRATGAVKWDKSVAPAAGAEEVEVAEDAGFAAPTPATDGKRVYAAFATGTLVAFDFDGNQAWMRNLGRPQSAYGFVSSPIVANGVLVIQFDQGNTESEGKSKLLGIDPATGKDLWATPRPVPNSWASPAIARTAQRTEVITCAAPWVIAYDPARGAELWRAKGLNGDVVPSPAFGGGLVFATADSAKLLAIRPDGAGDVTATHVAWTAEDGTPDISSPVSDGRFVLQAASGGYLTCYETATGTKAWEHYLESGQTASPVLAGGRVYLAGEDGVIRIFKMGEAFEMIDKGEVGEAVYATPAFVDSRIYVRGEANVFCIGAQTSQSQAGVGE